MSICRQDLTHRLHKVVHKLVRFAHNWNNGIVESWNDGFKETSTQNTCSALIFIL